MATCLARSEGLPEFAHIVQFSGGAGSFWAAHHAVTKHGAENVVLLFADTLIEDQDLYVFLGQASSRLGARLVIIREGRTPWEVFRDVNYLGNSRVDPCSRILKREACQKWVKARYSIDDCVLYLGIDWMESHRVKNVQRFWSPYNVSLPLVDDISYDKHRKLEEMRRMGIIVPRLYEMGMPHNNCGGGCVKAGKAHFLNLLEKLPSRFKEWEENEAKLQEHLGKPYTILREVREGKKHYISLRELRERAEEHRNTEQGVFDWGGCGCFIDDEG